MIIGLLGYAQSGKDSVASILTEEFGYTRVAFADLIRSTLYDLNPQVEGSTRLTTLVDDYGWDVAKSYPEVRRLLQDLGVSVRTRLGADIWVTAVFESLDPLKDYVFTDVRFPNEADAIQAIGGDLWRVIRPGVSAINNHISEVALSDFIANEHIYNSGTLEDLASQIREHRNFLNSIYR